MSLITSILAAVAALVVGAQFAFSVWYRHRIGTAPGPSAWRNFRAEIPPDQLVILTMFVLGLLIGVAAPVFWPDSAFAQWMREPYATAVYFAWCYVGMLVLSVARAVAIVLRKRRVK
jgi:hypothetical protein